MRKALLIFGGFMLAGLFALVMFSEFASPRPRGFTADLAQALPEVSGWQRREIPIAGSSAVEPGRRASTRAGSTRVTVRPSGRVSPGRRKT